MLLLLSLTFRMNGARIEYRHIQRPAILSVNKNRPTMGSTLVNFYLFTPAKIAQKLSYSLNRQIRLSSIGLWLLLILLLLLLVGP